jgi:hypothetical protein
MALDTNLNTSVQGDKETETEMKQLEPTAANKLLGDMMK